MMRFLVAAGVAVLVAGCGSAVKLDEVPVEDRSGTAVVPVAGGTAAGGPGSGGVARSAVTPVELGRTGGAGDAMSASQRVVYFDYDSFAIKPEYQGIVQGQARYILADRKVKVAVEGHTDERGGREYNLALGQKRAEAVRRALELLGVAEGQVEAVSYGKEKPAVQGSDEASLAKNRRAEIVYR